MIGVDIGFRKAADAVLGRADSFVVRWPSSSTDAAAKEITRVFLIIQMVRVYRNKKDCEKFLIREFVGKLGYRVSNPKWQDCPDALLTIRNARGKRRIAIEHTDHHNDTVAGQMSPLTPTIEFWRLVETSLIRRISHRKHLTGVLAGIKFMDDPPFPMGRGRSVQIAKQSLARQLAKELVDFALEHPVSKNAEFHIYRKFDLHGYPTISRLLNSLRLSRFTDDDFVASRASWTCQDVTSGHVITSLDFIRSSIAKKNKAAANYANWGVATERWLLIVCGGGDVNTRAGRFDLDVNWCDSALSRLCRASPFDRIYVWDRIHSQTKSLKP